MCNETCPECSRLANSDDINEVDLFEHDGFTVYMVSRKCPVHAQADWIASYEKHKETIRRFAKPDDNGFAVIDWPAYFPVANRENNFLVPSCKDRGEINRILIDLCVFTTDKDRDFFVIADSALNPVLDDGEKVFFRSEMDAIRYVRAIGLDLKIYHVFEVIDSKNGE